VIPIRRQRSGPSSSFTCAVALSVVNKIAASCQATRPPNNLILAQGEWRIARTNTQDMDLIGGDVEAGQRVHQRDHDQVVGSKTAASLPAVAYRMLTAA